MVLLVFEQYHGSRWLPGSKTRPPFFATVRTTAMTTSATPSAQPDRSLPQELIDLAVLAIKRGALSVSLGHESLGYEFQAPIGWMLWISEADENGMRKERAHLISHQIGCTFDDFVLPEVFADAPEEPVIDVLVELFQTAVKNGWDAAYERRMIEHRSFEVIHAERGLTSPFGMRHELRCGAHNWSYDQAARDRGDRVSTQAVLILGLPVEPGSTEPTDPIAFTDHGGEHRQTTRSHIEALLSNTAPHFVPVAYFDDELETWVK
jgi:hypothetical protein